jgi:hypothetical protein
MTIIRDTAAELLPVGQLLGYEQVVEARECSEEICSTEQDNDAETWEVTGAGQILRICGSDQDRFYVWDSLEALEFLYDWAERDRLLLAWTEEEIAAYEAGRLSRRTGR